MATTNQRVSDEQHRQALELRCKHSLWEEAKTVFRHLLGDGRGSQEIENAIIENLLG